MRADLYSRIDFQLGSTWHSLPNVRVIGAIERRRDYSYYVTWGSTKEKAKEQASSASSFRCTLNLDHDTWAAKQTLLESQATYPLRVTLSDGTTSNTLTFTVARPTWSIQPDLGDATVVNLSFPMISDPIYS